MPLDNAPPSASGSDLDPVFDEAGQRFDVDPNLLRAQSQVESNGNRYAISPAGAVGLMQVKPDTYSELRQKYPDLSANPFQARSNIMAGAAYLRQMHDQFGSTGAVAAYNAGPGRYQDFLNGDTELPDETKQYVSKVTDAYAKRTQQQTAPQPKTPDVRSLIDASRKMGASDDEIRTQMQKSPLLAGLWEKSDASGIPRADVFAHFGLQPTGKPGHSGLPMAQTDQGGYQPTNLPSVPPGQNSGANADDAENGAPPAPGTDIPGIYETAPEQPATPLPRGYVGPGQPYQGGMDFNLPGGERHFTPTDVKVPGQTSAAAYRAAAVQGLIGGLGQDVKGASEFAGAVSAGEARPVLAAMDTIDQGKAAPAMFKGMSDAQKSQATAYLRASPPIRQQMRSAMAAQVQGENQVGSVGAVGQNMIDAARTNFPIDPSQEGFTTGVVRGAAGAIPMIGAVAGGTALGGPAGGIVAGAAAIGAQSFDATRQDALSKGAAPEVADRAATESALANMGIMALPVGRVIQSVPGVGTGLLRAVQTMAKNGFEFGSFNALSQFVTNYVKKTTYDTNQKLMDGTGQSAAEGFVTGLLFGVPHAAGEASRAAANLSASDMFARGAGRVRTPGTGEGFTAEDEGGAPPPAAPGLPAPGPDIPPAPPAPAAGPTPPPAAVSPAPVAAPPPTPVAAAPSAAEAVLANIAAGKPATGGVEALQAMAAGKPAPAAAAPTPAPPPVAPPASVPPAPVALPPAVEPAEEPQPFEWSTAKVGDRLPDGRGVIVGKGMTRKADAEMLAEQQNGTVWQDGPRQWAVVVPEREQVAEGVEVQRPSEDVPVKTTVPAAASDVDQAAAQTAEPTPGQIEAGNYKKGRTSIGGMPVTIETPRGAMRRGVGPDGQPWEVQMPDHYGYFAKPDGADGDKMDVTLGPYAHEAEKHPAFVVDQIDPATGKFDEHKTFVGYPTAEAATAAYDASFSDGSGPARRGAVNAMSFPDFKEWAENGDTTKPLSYQQPTQEPAQPVAALPAPAGKPSSSKPLGALAPVGDAGFPAVRAGERLRSKSGRELTPVPNFNTDTNRTANIARSRLNVWLLTEARKEAAATRDTHVGGLLRGMDPKNFSQSDRDTASDVLWGDETGPKPEHRIAAQQAAPATEHPGLVIKSLETGKVTKIQPAGTVPPKDTTGLTLPGMGAGISESLRDHLWERAEAGRTDSAGAPDNALIAAKAVRDRGGLQTREEFDRFLAAIGPLLSDRTDGWQKRILDAAAAFVPKAPEAPPTPAAPVGKRPVSQEEHARLEIKAADAADKLKRNLADKATTPERRRQLIQQDADAKAALNAVEAPPAVPRNKSGKVTAAGAGVLRDHDDQVALHRFQTSTDVIADPANAYAGLAPEGVKSVHGIDSKNNEWVGTGHALVRLDADPSLKPLVRKAEKRTGLSVNRVPTEAIDRVISATGNAPIVWERTISNADGTSYVIGKLPSGARVALQKAYFNLLARVSGADGTLTTEDVKPETRTSTAGVVARNAGGDLVGIAMPYGITERDATISATGFTPNGTAVAPKVRSTESVPQSSQEAPPSTEVPETPPRREYDQYLTDPGSIAANKYAIDALNGDISQRDAVAGLGRLVRDGAIPEGVARVNLERLDDWTEGEWKQAKQPPEDQGAPPLEQPAAGGERPADYGADNKFFTADAAARARARLREKLNRLNAGFDPEFALDGLTLAGFHIEAGMRRFADYARAMIDDLGARVIPHLDQFYTAVRKQHGFDTAGMDDDATIAAELHQMVGVPTSEGQEAENGVQRGVPASDAGSGAEDVHGVAPVGDVGGVRPGEIGAGAPDAASDTAVANAGQEQPSDNAPGEGGGGAGQSADDRVPAARPERNTGAARRPAERPDADVTGENHVIEPGALEESRGPKAKALGNVAAIQLAKRLLAEQRPATKSEQSILAKYVGWGGLKGAFRASDGAFGKGLEDVGRTLENILGPEEYATAERSTQYAHYTAEHVVRSMWDAVRRMGFDGGRVFEPGMGIGHFLGLMPPDLSAKSTYRGVEMDRLTADIAKLLYPKAGVQTADFSQMALPEKAFDLVIGNPPFSDTVVSADPKYRARGFMLHDYFFAKSLDAVRPGGLLGFITSAGTMNKMDSKAREYLAQRAEFAGGIRLPAGTFRENARTDVTTDVLFFKRRTGGDVTFQNGQEPPWTQVTRRQLQNREGNTVEGNVSRYFSENPENVLGEEGFFDKLVAGGDRYSVRSLPGSDVKTDLPQAISRLPTDIMEPEPSPETKAALDFSSDEKKDGSFYLDSSGRIMQYRSGAGRPVPQRGKGTDGGFSAAEIERIQHLVPVRDALREVFSADLARDEDHGAAARAKLNDHYDRFVNKFGPINKADFQFRRPNAIQQETARLEAREEARFVGMPFDDGDFDPSSMVASKASIRDIAAARQTARDAAVRGGRTFDEGTFDPDNMPDVVIERRPNIKPFMDDPESYRLRSIEKYNDATGEAEKRPIFFRNILKHEQEPEIRSANDGVLWSMNQFGRFDLDKIAEKMGVDRPALISELGDAIFKLPGTRDTYQTSGEYLSGDVVSKLEMARAEAERDPDIERNISALEAAQPVPLAPSQISMVLGMPWIPIEHIKKFVGETLEMGSPTLFHSKVTGQWSVDPGRWISSPGAPKWGTDRRTAFELLSDALNRTPPRIYDTFRGPDGTQTVFNPVATQAAQDKVEAIKEAFAKWTHADEDRADGLAKIYNAALNRTVLRQYDGSYLTTPGVSADWSWRPHQKRVISRVIQNGTTYMAHAVGSGKTSNMIGSAMEMRRLGLVKKPMFVVPNHMLGQFTKEFYEQYPTARIAVADDQRFITHNRRQFVANVAQDDLDAVIITHSGFGMIPISEEFQGEMIQEQLDELTEAIREAKAAGAERFTVGRLQNQREKLEQKLRGQSGGKKDQTLTFEQMGVDFLFVDEAHQFRKLQFATRQQGLKGIDPTGSNMAFDLYTKVRYLDRQNPGRAAVFASGTPVTNTMGELYSLSRFMQPQALADKGLSSFDAWAQTFGDTKTGLEETAAGTYQPVTRFGQFLNLPELYKMVGEVMDIVTPAQLEQYVTRPQIQGGKRQFHLAPRTPILDAYQQDLGRRMEAIKARGGKAVKGQDILLSVINDGRHAAIDPRFVAETGNNPDSKLNIMIQNVVRIHNETTNHVFYDPRDNYQTPVMRGPATQMIFSNLGVNGRGPMGFSGYAWIKEALRRAGIPAPQIAIIGDYKTAIQRQALFNDINEGKVRVLLGSTQKMGTGVNAQRRLASLHNLDPLWYPSDDEQRVGRILRQGNLNREIQIHDYSTKGTYDSAMWKMMGNKARFIEQFFRGDPELRNMEDLGEASMYEQASAMSTTDERVIALTELKQNLDRARRRRDAHNQEQFSLRRQLENKQYSQEREEGKIANLTKAIARREDTAGDAFSATIGGQVYAKRADAADALEAIERDRSPALMKNQETTLGKIGGFPIVLSNEWGLRLRTDNGEYSIRGEGGRGKLASAESVLRGFEADRDWAGKYRDRYIAEGEAIKPLIGKKFEGDQEIDDLATKAADMERDIKENPASAAADGGTEGENEAPDRSILAEQEGATRWPEGGGPNFRDLTNQAPEGGPQAAGQWVVDQGRKTGHEHIAVVDDQTGRVVHAGTNGNEDAVEFRHESTAGEKGSYTLHHNHPNNSAISGQDIAALANPNVSHVVAHGHDGNISGASLGPRLIRDEDLTHANLAENQRKLSAAHARAKAEAKDMLARLVTSGHVTPDVAQQSWMDVTSRLLQARSVINYNSTRDLPMPITNAIRAHLRSIGYDADTANRSTVSVRPEGGSGILPWEVPGRPGPNGEANGSGGQGVSEGPVVSGNGREPGLAQSRPGIVESGREVGASESPAEPGGEIATARQGLTEDRDRFDQEHRLYSFPAALFDPAVWRRAFDGISAMDLRKGMGLAQSSQDGMKLARKAMDEVHTLFSPTSRGEGAKGMEHIIRARASMLARAGDQSAFALEKLSKAVDKLPEDQQLEITDRVERGVPQLTPELQATMTALKEEQDKWLRKIQSIGRLKDIENSDDYMGRLYSNYPEWKAGQQPPDEATGQGRVMGGLMGKSPIRGRAGFLKERTFDTLADAMQAGLIPVTTNPIKMQMMKLREMQRFYYGTRMADDIKASGIARWVSAANEGQARAEGLIKLDDPFFQPKLKPDRFGVGANGAPMNMRIDPGAWYAPAPAANIFNHYVSRGPAGRSVIYDAMRRSGNALNSAQLGLSGFHATFVTLDSIMSHMALGMQQAVRAATGHDLGTESRLGTLKTGLTTMATSPIAPVTTMMRGNALRRAWLDPQNATPEMRRLADMLNAGGGRINMDQFYRANASGSFFKSLADIKNFTGAFREAWDMVKDTPLRSPFRIAGRMIDTINEPLMGQMVPRMKLGVFTDMARDYLARFPDATPEEASDAMTKAWDSVENRMGQMTYDNIFWNKTQKDVAMLLQRSVGWNLGTIREIGGGSAPDSVRFLRDLASGKRPDFTGRMAYPIAMTVVTAMVGAFLTYLMTGHGPKQMLDYFYPPTGSTDAGGEPNRLSIPGYIKDVVAYKKDPAGTILNKLNPLLEMGKEVYYNRDYYGGSLYDPKFDKSATGAYAEYLMNEALPFSIRATIKNRSEGESMETQMLSFWGIQPAPQSVVHPEKEEKWQSGQDKRAYRERLKEEGKGRLAPFSGQ